MEQRVKSELREFILSSYLFGDTTRAPDDDTSLIEEGIIDSTGVLELIEFLEDHFGIEVAETETIPDNLGSISNLTRFVIGKLGSRTMEKEAAAGQIG